jgi:hypothetical protein
VNALLRLLMIFPRFKNEAVKEGRSLFQKVQDSDKEKLEDAKKELKGFLCVTGITRRSLKRYREGE